MTVRFYRNPALEAERRPHQDAGHLIMPNGSILSSADWAFMTAAAPYVLALHLAERANEE